jgi:hypothetical protein
VIVNKSKVVWTEELDRKLAYLWLNEPRAVVAAKMGMNEAMTYRRAKLLGLTLDQKRASFGGVVMAPQHRDAMATRNFEEVFRAVAARNNWHVHKYEGAVR